jgi:phage shock protein C
MSLADEIRKLVDLRDAGHLDQEEFERAKARLLNSNTPIVRSDRDTAYESGSGVPRLRRSTRDRWIGGVCGGLGAYTGIESWVWRMLFAVAVCFAGFGLLPYVLLWIFVPLDSQA